MNEDRVKLDTFWGTCLSWGQLASIDSYVYIYIDCTTQSLSIVMLIPEG
jgi:hypothetical protein